jgi:hypothetical protein
MDNLLFYDIEVTAFDSLVVFLNRNKEEVAHFWNNRDRKTTEDPSGFEDIPDLIRDKTLVGYNNYFYDDNILTVMMNFATSWPDFIKATNDRIISGERFSGRKSPLIRSLDTMQQIDVSHPSLKQIEGNMGISIVESSVDFNIGRPLTDAEREEMLFYCRHDVAATVDIYNLREKSYFETKESLLTMMPEDKRTSAARWNTTTLSANILLGDTGLVAWEKHGVPAKYWRNVEEIPSAVWDMWEDITGSMEAVTGKGRSVKIKAYGCTFVFGLGGLHGAPDKPLVASNIKLADVGSMYPSLIKMLRALGDATDMYDSIRLERLAIKHSDPVRAGALKLVLNSVYGLFKSKYSALFNPMASATVCIYGQIALFKLCGMLHDAGYKIINANTDGVAFVDDPELGGAYLYICKEWEKEFEGLLLEVDEFDKWIQKDVNNYIATHDGQIKVKGGEVNKYHKDKFFSNNNIRIVQKALVDNLVYGTPVYKTFVDNLDKPILWQYILKAGGTFQGVQDAAGVWQNNVNRVFAAKPEYPGTTKLYKIRKDGGQVNFPDSPERMFIWNGDLKDIPDFKEMIDLDHYMDLVNKKLRGWPSVC